jgi:hypothetical protein
MPYPRVKQQPARSGPTQKRGLRATGTSGVLPVSTVQKKATLTVMGSIRRKLTHPKSKQDLLFRNQSTGKALSDRIWRDSLQEMLVESGLTTLAEGDSNDLRKTEIASGKNLTWYSFRHTWITLHWKEEFLSRPYATTAIPQSSTFRSTTSTATQRERLMHSQLVGDNSKVQLGTAECGTCISKMCNHEREM